MILKGFGFVAFFAGVKASSVLQNSIDFHVNVTGVVMNSMYGRVPDFSFRNKHVLSYVSLVRTYSCGMLRKIIEYTIHFLKIIVCMRSGMHILKIGARGAQLVEALRYK
jgi:hypothetical protein